MDKRILELAEKLGFEVKNTLSGGLDFISSSKLIRLTFNKNSNLFQAYAGKLSTFSSLEELEKELELRSREYQNALKFCRALKGDDKIDKEKVIKCKLCDRELGIRDMIFQVTEKVMRRGYPGQWRDASYEYRVITLVQCKYCLAVLWDSACSFSPPPSLMVSSETELERVFFKKILPEIKGQERKCKG